MFGTLATSFNSSCRQTLCHVIPGQRYWQLERSLCSRLLRQEEIQAAEVLAAHECKSFDYRVMHLLLHKLIGERLQFSLKLSHSTLIEVCRSECIVISKTSVIMKGATFMHVLIARAGDFEALLVCSAAPTIIRQHRSSTSGLRYCREALRRGSAAVFGGGRAAC